MTYGEKIELSMTEDGIIFAEIDGDWGKGATVDEAIAYLRGTYVHGRPDYPVEALEAYFNRPNEGTED